MKGVKRFYRAFQTSLKLNAARVPLSAADCSIIENSFSDRIRTEFNQLKESSSGQYEVRKLVEIFEKDTDGIERFLAKVLPDFEIEKTNNITLVDFLILMTKELGVAGIQRAFLRYIDLLYPLESGDVAQSLRQKHILYLY